MSNVRKILHAGWSVVRALSQEPLPGESALILALASRTRELVPQDDFVVSADGLSVTLSGIGAFSGLANVIMPVFILRLELPVDERLEFALHSYGKRLASFLTHAYRGVPWPTEDAERHVSVDAESVELWWTQADGPDRVNLYALSRRDLQV